MCMCTSYCIQCGRESIRANKPIKRILTRLRCKNRTRGRFIALLMNANSSVIIVGGAQMCGFKMHFMVCPPYFNREKKKKIHFRRSQLQKISKRKTTSCQVTKRKKEKQLQSRFLLDL